MKRTVFSVIVFMMMVVTGFGQTKPIAKDISLGFRITGLSNISFNQWSQDDFDFPQVMGRYYLTDRIAFRGRLGIDLSDVSTNFDRSIIDTENFGQAVRIDSSTSVSNSAFSFSFAPGAEYHLLADAAKLDPYVAAEIPFSILGTNSTNLDLDVVRTDAAGTVLYKEDVNVKTDVDGGLSVGLNLIGGFNYFFSPKVAIGAEYAIGLGYKQDGGTVVVASTGTIQPTADPANILAVNSTERFQNSTTTLDLGVRSTAGVNISIFW